MSIVVIQAAGSLGLSSPSYSMPTLPTAGHGIIVGIQLGLSVAGTVTAVSDNQGVGNTYTKVVNEPTVGGGSDVELWQCTAIGATSGTFTITATNTGTLTGSNSSMGAMEVTGLGAIDKTGVAQTNSVATLTATASGANANANDLVIGAISSNSTSASSFGAPTSAYSAWFNETVAGNYWVSFGYKIVSGIETSAATGTWGNAANACAFVATFTPTAGGGSGSGNFFLMPGFTD